MTNERAISELNQIYGILSPDKQIAIDTAITAMGLMALLSDRPCEACKNHTSGGCIVWKCPFDGGGTE